MTSLATPPAPLGPTPARRPGRPRARVTPAESRRRFHVVNELLLGETTADAIAAMVGISRRTLFLWRRQVLATATGQALLRHHQGRRCS